MEGGSNKISHTVQLGSIPEFDKQSTWLGPWGRNISAVFPQFWLSGQVRFPAVKVNFIYLNKGVPPKNEVSPKSTKNSVCKIVPPKRAVWNGSSRGGSSKRVMCLCVVSLQLFPPLHSEMWECWCQSFALEWQQEIIGAAVENANRTITAEMLDIVIRKHTGNATSELSY